MTGQPKFFVTVRNLPRSDNYLYSKCYHIVIIDVLRYLFEDILTFVCINNSSFHIGLFYSILSVDSFISM
jgi:hypothetical protein